MKTKKGKKERQEKESRGKNQESRDKRTMKLGIENQCKIFLINIIYILKEKKISSLSFYRRSLLSHSFYRRRLLSRSLSIIF